MPQLELGEQSSPQETTPNNDFRRRAYIRMSPEAIVQLLRAKEVLVLDHDGRAYSLTSTLPADAQAIRGWVRAVIGDQGDVCIVVESESFEPVPWGQEIPEIRVLTTARTVAPPFPVTTSDEPSPLEQWIAGDDSQTEAANAILSHVPDFAPSEFNKSPV